MSDAPKLCGIKSRPAKYAAGTPATDCPERADLQARCGVCGWRSPFRCARHAKAALAKHNTTRHAQLPLPYEKPSTPREDL